MISIQPVAPPPFHWWSAAPHRPFFAVGLVQMVLTIAWWGAELTARHTGWWPMLDIVYATWAHQYLMLSGFIPFLLCGFLLTIVPRWLGQAEIPAQKFVLAWSLMTAGALVFWIGMFTSEVLLGVGVVLTGLGWVLGWITLMRRLLRGGRAEGRRHVAYALTGAGLGIVAHFAWGVWLWRGDWIWLDLARELGVWGMMVLMLMVVLNRMYPVFAINGLHEQLGSLAPEVAPPTSPSWFLPLAVALIAGRVTLAVLGEQPSLWLFDLPLLTAAAWVAWGWRLPALIFAPLAWTLYVGWMWLLVGLTLEAIQSGALALGYGELFGKAPLHALAIGLFGSVFLGVAGRVCRGHSGRPMAADRLTTAVFILFQAAVLARVLGEFPQPGGDTPFFNIAAALIWVICAVGFAWRHLQMVVLPRVDGRPG
ncbi:MAG: hypothetical protein AUJ55_02710 [Proteobacteria bacterium CG1_02_64_396]|nr:MAG: hypothetical protein AUJ55_02710 [Proteobacteria bacterium CG1_02_64_396]